MAGERYDAVIVGAGIAGLTAAWELRDRAILVLEAADRVGGRMRSEPRGPYWLNLGAHLFGGPGSLLDRLIKEVGLETRPRRSALRAECHSLSVTEVPAPLGQYDARGRPQGVRRDG